MKKRKKMKGRGLWLLLQLCILCLLLPLQTEAADYTDASVYGNPNVIFTYDGQCWTTDYLEKGYEKLEMGYTLTTGVTSSLPQVQVGQHEYPVTKTGIMPIEKWEVSVFAPGKCIHTEYRYSDHYHGLPAGTTNCYGKYKNGWWGYCADCHEKYPLLFYMDTDTAKTITSVPIGLSYFYSCPHCENVEQSDEIYHECKDVSWNKYKIEYKENGLSVTGIMPNSVHMYNNETMYRGEKITPHTHLRKNRYKREGYEFTGWNTERDGSGQSFVDGEEIFNLTAEEGQTIFLYAQWRKCESTLQIHPGSGKFDGASGIVTITGKYGTTYEVPGSRLTPPKGAVISFDSRGGSAVADIQAERFFKEWSLSYPFHGELEGDTYSFVGPDGSMDTITAIYGHKPVTLPEATKEGVEFGGWYKDKECTQLVGPAGAEVIFTENTTLYAGWVSLRLTSVDDYESHGGSGAVDLYWKNLDNTAAAYQVHQQKEDGSWVTLDKVNPAGESLTETFPFSGSPKVYIVPYTGIYKLTATGAQGEDYTYTVEQPTGGATKEKAPDQTDDTQNQEEVIPATITVPGGKGGQVQALAFLQKGEILTINVGASDGYNGGGSGAPYGSGGGRTNILSSKRGTLLVAGGGGGASILKEGGPGGAQTSLTGNYMGGSGAAGGGGGYLGGNAGEALYHVHDDVECGYHEHQGSLEKGGECYTGIACGNTTFTHSGGEYLYSFPHWDNDGSGICVQCNYNFGLYGNVSNAHDANSPDVYTCNKCGTEYNWPKPASCTAGATYTLSCTFQEGYNCGKTDKTIESAKTAYGGSNYVNSGSCVQIASLEGVGEGNGSFVLSLEAAVFVDGMELLDVSARDEAAPEAVSKYSKVAAGDGMIRFTWQRPADNGTLYRHQVSAHELSRGAEIGRSNITENTLVSGVRGYYYLVDEKEKTSATQANASFTETPSLEVEVKEGIRYVHIAAVDVAGNVSKSVHLKVDNSDPLVNWPIYTGQIAISSGHDSVYPAGEKTWYVRADGQTSFLASFTSHMNHEALPDYQINYNMFQITSPEGMQVYKVHAPSRAISEEPYTYNIRELLRETDGARILTDGMYTQMVRRENNKHLSLDQGFVVSPEKDGQSLQLIPVAGAVMKNGKLQYSDKALDALNGVTLIADAQAPVVSGLEKLEHFEELDRTTEEAVVTITADDSGSGVRELYAVIQNAEDYSSKTVTAEGGILTLDFRDVESSLYNGYFSVKVYAVDRVGNTFVYSGDLCFFTMETKLYRILEPQGREFQAGESGMIQVDTCGYAEEIFIYYPSKWQEKGSPEYELLTYEGEVPFQGSRQLQFMVPLEVPDDTYVFRIRAISRYGRELETTEELQVEGSVLDDFRTRLR